MGWERYGDGLRLVGARHFDVTQVDAGIDRLSSARNRPGTMCRLLREGVKSGVFPRDTLWPLSRWCNWDDPSERDAQQISRLLFGEVPQRFLGKQGEVLDNALANYQNFLTSVVARHQH